MKAVILAAGEGRRLRPFTETMPKVMLPVANKPILEHIVDALKKSGIQEIIFVVGYKKEVIMEHFKDYEDVKIDYVLQDKQLGTAHALLQAKGKIKNSFLVISGDNIIDKNSISKIIQNKSEYCMLINENPHPSKYGAVFLEGNKLKKITKQSPDETGYYISTGIYKFPPKIFENIKKFTSQGNYSLFSVIQSLVDSGKNIATIKADFWMDVVYPWDIINVNEKLIQNISGSTNGTIEKGVVLKGPVSIGKNTTIYSGSYIVGPVIIGEGCEIGPNTCIFPSTVIGDNTVIHPFSEIRNSVIMNDVHIGSNSSLSHSLIGRGSILHSNFSNIYGEACVEIENEFKKLKDVGVMIAEDVTINNHVVVNPGVIIGRRCIIAPLKKIVESIPSNTKVM